jgi:HSP20 family protein
MASRSLSAFSGSQLGRPRGGAGAPAYFSVLREMNRLLDDTFRGALGLTDTGGSGVTALTPRINVSETDEEIRIEAEMPGVPEENVQVDVIDDMLTIRGEQEEEREEDRGENYHVVERVYGTFVRTIQLPFSVDPEQIDASFQNGVLTITVPKSAAESKRHRVQIGGGSARGQGAASSGVDRAAAGDKPTSAADTSGAGGTTQAPSGEGESAQGTGASGADRATAGDKPTGAAGTAGAGETTPGQTGEGGTAEPAESGQKSTAAQ